MKFDKLNKDERELLVAKLTDQTAGRPLEELLKTDEILKGAESQRLRTYFSSNHMEPSRDLNDIFGRAVMMGDLETVQAVYNTGVAAGRHSSDDSDQPAQTAAAADVIYEKRWGPTRVPVYNLILLSTLINAKARPHHLKIARWLIDEAKVPVDGKDLSGSTALHHAISTKPAFDPDYAQILYDAGAVVTHRNRYGNVPAHEIAMTWDPTNRDAVRKAAKALQWYLEHGGNLDIKDSDGISPRESINKTKQFARSGIKMETWRVVDAEDMRRAKLVGQVCTFCGRGPRGDVTLLACSKCKLACYCSGGAPCQKSDWPHHKIVCKKPAAA